MKNAYPLVSVIVNVFNERDTIVRCLTIIRQQKYPQNKIEIILVDDDSTDNTIDLAIPYKVKVVRSGYKNIERSKSIGIQQAKGEFILLLDADVFLENANWIEQAVTFLISYPKAVAVQAIRWKYKKQDTLMNRYCNLFGVNDPFVFFLGKRGALMATEREWIYKNTILKKLSHAWLVRFSPENLPTVGAQGYMVRSSYIKKTSWKPYFFHLDTAYELVQQGRNEFIMSDLPITHLYATSIKEFYMKLNRNIHLFLELKKYRKYTYTVTRMKFIFVVLTMMTVFIPLYQSIKGYKKIHDVAWFLHPLFCFTIPILYTYVVIKHQFVNREYRTLESNSI